MAQSPKPLNDLCTFPRQVTIIQVCEPTTNAEDVEVEQFHKDLQDLLQLIPIKDVIFIIEDWNAKVGSQEIHGETVKFGLGLQN